MFLLYNVVGNPRTDNYVSFGFPGANRSKTLCNGLIGNCACEAAK